MSQSEDLKIEFFKMSHHFNKIKYHNALAIISAY